MAYRHTYNFFKCVYVYDTTHKLVHMNFQKRHTEIYSTHESALIYINGEWMAWGKAVLVKCVS